MQSRVCSVSLAPNLVGNSPPFRKLLQLLNRFASYDVTLLIEGETGTGKELVGRAIHYASARKGMPFVPVNCGALPDSLIENELFGHRRGAYTGASETHCGLIAQANGGTLFLDEIDALSAKGQVTLLRFMQDLEYRPLGSIQSEKVDVRIIAASNADLMKCAARGEFRQDLLYRLRVLTLELPPLRERQGDVELLAMHYLRLFSKKYGKPEKALNPESLAWMNRYAWPGNVRELENLIHREFLLAEGPILSIPSPAGHEERRQQPDRRGIDVDIGFAAAKARVVNDFEKRYLQALLTRSRGNVTQAARLAGKERRALGKLLKKHGLDRLQANHPDT